MEVGFVFDKAKVAIVKKIFESVFPDRDFDIENVGKSLFAFQHDAIGCCGDFLLEGQYTYDQVVELNKLTGYSAGFGFCKELGPVAFIGVPNRDAVQRSAYFDYEIEDYDAYLNGMNMRGPMYQYYSEQLSDEEAKEIGNYTVYGMGDPRIFKNIVPIKKTANFYDFRYKCKCCDEFDGKLYSDVLEMEIKVDGTFSFYEARKFAYRSTGKFNRDCYDSSRDVPIQFAIVGDNQPVGILNLYHQYNHTMFRDVWSPNEDEPEKLPMRFLSDEEAEKINNFQLYYFASPYGIRKKPLTAEKIDRTLYEDFDFIMSDGTDYRLQDVKKNTNNQHTKVKTMKQYE